MTKYVICPDVALRLAVEKVAVPDGVELLAPTLFRSQLLAQLFRLVRAGAMSRQDAERHLSTVRGLRMRLLGDRVLQRVAWRIADDLGWPDTLDAEYVALTQLQADALVTFDAALAAAVAKLVSVAPYAALLGTSADG